MSDIALKKELPPEVSGDVLAHVGCVAGAIPFEEYRRGLIEAGFGEVAVIDSGADLNAYSKAGSPSDCCTPPTKEETPGAAEEAAGWCCGPAPTAESGARDVLSRYDINDYAASVKVFAVKPG